MFTVARIPYVRIMSDTRGTVSPNFGKITASVPTNAFITAAPASTPAPT